VRGSTLARNFDETMALAQEVLLEPRFDPDEFELSRQRVANALRQRAASPVAVAGDVFQRLLYGDHILAENGLGSLDTIDDITLDDLRAYYAGAVSPERAALHVTGAVRPRDVVASVGRLELEWAGDAAALPEPPAWVADRAGLYFVDVPGASQSVLRIGYLALAQTDEDYYPATVMNFRLGGGGFASDLTQALREQRGYTYGIGSGFGGTDAPGPFQISTSVRANVTYEALDLIKTIVEAHGPEFDDEDLEATKSFLLRVNARAFETGGAKLGLLSAMSAYGFPADFFLEREEIVRLMTIDDVRRLADDYLDPEGMIWLVVGDAETQRDRLTGLGLGTPVMLDREGRPIPN
ncbi:MAG: insulinase family protein, partial [Gemmatimonadota bacterium]|nr:insulinase family protein [Gemmatimonadota bacterium]